MDKYDVDDILDITDTSDSSSDPGIFETKQFVLELHEIKKDEPVTDTVTPVSKVKRKRKRSQQPTDLKSGSSSSISAPSDSVPRLTDAKDEFYDADGSFHEITEDSPTKLAATATLAQVHSDQSKGPKSVPNGTTQTQLTSASTREPNTITKPVQQPK